MGKTFKTWSENFYLFILQRSRLSRGVVTFLIFVVAMVIALLQVASKPEVGWVLRICVILGV